MRRVYITFSDDDSQAVFGPIWCIEQPGGSPDTSGIEDLIDYIQRVDDPKGSPTLWFDNPPKTGESA